MNFDRWQKQWDIRLSLFSGGDFLPAANRVGSGLKLRHGPRGLGASLRGSLAAPAVIRLQWRPSLLLLGVVVVRV